MKPVSLLVSLSSLKKLLSSKPRDFYTIRLQNPLPDLSESGGYRRVAEFRPYDLPAQVILATSTGRLGGHDSP